MSLDYYMAKNYHDANVPQGTLLQRAVVTEPDVETIRFAGLDFVANRYVLRGHLSFQGTVNSGLNLEFEGRGFTEGVNSHSATMPFPFGGSFSGGSGSGITVGSGFLMTTDTERQDNSFEMEFFTIDPAAWMRIGITEWNANHPGVGTPVIARRWQGVEIAAKPGFNPTYFDLKTWVSAPLGRYLREGTIIELHRKIG